jgi:histidinol-phosphate aminotransferase
MSFIRPNIERIEGYRPGEQPQETGWVKLNTNENPYPPTPRVEAAIRAAASARLNLYPDPLATDLRRVAADLFDVDAEWILPANGSDENLTMLLRTFVDPGELVSFPYPSYVLYETLADIQGAAHACLWLDENWDWEEAAARQIVERSKLVLICNPNSPSGNRWSDEQILSLVPPRGLLVLDEAYGDFCDAPHRGELLHGDAGRRIVVTRSLSKSYSLAGLRCGFAMAHPEWVTAMRKVKDSYNCDRIAIAAATAALRDQEWMRGNVGRIVATRTRLTAELRQLSFHVVDSQANFVWATHPGGANFDIYQQLKQRRILVRYMAFDRQHQDRAEQGQRTGLRITVGTDDEIDRLLSEMRKML